MSDSTNLSEMAQEMVPVVYIEMLNRLDYFSLLSYCRVNRKTWNFCKEPYLWQSRAMKYFGRPRAKVEHIVSKTAYLESAKIHPINDPVESLVVGILNGSSDRIRDGLFTGDERIVIDEDIFNALIKGRAGRAELSKDSIWYDADDRIWDLLSKVAKIYTFVNAMESTPVLPLGEWILEVLQEDFNFELNDRIDLLNLLPLNDETIERYRTMIHQSYADEIKIILEDVNQRFRTDSEVYRFYSSMYDREIDDENEEEINRLILDLNRDVLRKITTFDLEIKLEDFNRQIETPRCFYDLRDAYHLPLHYVQSRLIPMNVGYLKPKYVIYAADLVRNRFDEEQFEAMYGDAKFLFIEILPTPEGPAFFEDILLAGGAERMTIDQMLQRTGQIRREEPELFEGFIALFPAQIAAAEARELIDVYGSE